MSEEDKAEHSKILRFSSNTSSPTHDSSLKKYQATAKYDRKALNQRLCLEEWMHYKLRNLYECKVFSFFCIRNSGRFSTFR